MRKSILLCSAATMAIAGFSVTPALAQTDDADSASRDVITVTARRKDESLLETPVAVAAFDEESIQNLGIRSIDDLARHTAGLSFSQAFGRTTERPVIRGAANILAGVQFGVESGTAYFIDGVYYSGDLQALDTRNLARAEVIKGPQSALYGRNTYAGAINYISRLPSQGGNEVSLDATWAEDGEYEIYGRASTAMADGKFGVSLSGRYYEYGGDSFWINDDGGEQLGSEQTFSVNLVTDFSPTDNFSGVLRLGYVEDDDGPRPFRILGAEENNCYPGYRSGEYYDTSAPSFAPFAGVFPDTTTTDTNFQYFCGSLADFDDLRPAQTLNSAPFIGVEREMFFGTLKTDLELGGGYELLFQAGFRSEDRKTGSDSDHNIGEAQLDDGTFVFPISPFFSPTTDNGLFSFSDVSETTDFNVEFKLRSPVEDRFRWSLGLFYFNFDQDEFSINFGNPAPTFLGGRNARERIENSAAFGTLAYDITDQIELSFEARYQVERKAVTEFDPDTGMIDFDGDARFEDFIPKVILNYNPAPNMTIYASWAEGLKPGGINGPDGEQVNQVQYLPENANAFEVGFKTQYADGKGTLSIAGYYNDITNYQLTTPVASSGQVNSVATNQGDVEVLGIEVETTFDINDELTVGGTYAYTDATFTEGCDSFQFTLTSGGFVMAPIAIGDPSTFNQFAEPDPSDPSLPLNDPDGLFTGMADCSIVGNRVPMTSEHQFSAFTSYERPITNEWNLFTNIDYTFESSKFVQVHNGTETGDVGILGAQIGVRNDNLRIEVFGRNLTDNRTPPIATRWFDFYEGFNTIPSAVDDGIDDSVLGPRSPFLSFRRGRQIGVRARLDF